MVSYFGMSCRVPGLAWERITGFKSSEFLQNKASLRQFYSEKHPITTLIEILFPTRSLCEHLLFTLEYTFSTKNKYPQSKLELQLGRILTCLKNFCALLALFKVSMTVWNAHYLPGFFSRSWFKNNFQIYFVLIAVCWFCTPFHRLWPPEFR